MKFSLATLTGRDCDLYRRSAHDLALLGGDNQSSFFFGRGVRREGLGERGPWFVMPRKGSGPDGGETPEEPKRRHQHHLS